MDKEKRSRGRPRVAETARKRNNITIRMRDALRATLEEAAVANQRSVSEEIERRLEERELLAGILKRTDLAWVLFLIDGSINRIEKETGKAWHEDKGTVEQVLREAIMSFQERQERDRAVSAAVIADRLGARHRTTSEAAAPVGNDKIQDLSPRERQVLEQLRQGKQNEVIAYELDMSESTVKVYLRHIMKKLNLRNRTQLVSLADPDSLRAKSEVG
jgi:DNA-binding CsgD family transcriptional regulator